MSAPEFVPPRTAGPGTALGLLLALVLLGIGAVAVHDGLVLVGWIDDNEWVRSALNTIGRVEPTVAVAWIGAAVAVAGLALIVAAVTPRRRIGIRLRGNGGLYMQEVDVARIASGAARGVSSVVEASSAASRRKVVVRARTTIDQDATDLAQAAVTDRLAVLAEAPTVVVRTRRPR